MDMSDLVDVIGELIGFIFSLVVLLITVALGIWAWRTVASLLF